MSVKFLRAWKAYGQSDVATFASDVEKQLIEDGNARKYDAKEEASPSPSPSPSPAVSSKMISVRVLKRFDNLMEGERCAFTEQVLKDRKLEGTYVTRLKESDIAEAKSVGAPPKNRAMSSPA